MCGVPVRGCVCSVQCVKCALFVFFVGYVCFAYGFVSAVCVFCVCDGDLCVRSCLSG